MTSTRPRLRTQIVVLLALAASSAGSQTNLDAEAGLQFNFVPPGARSLAFGGAFSGLADDATAAFANPAGLLQLTSPEVSLEYRDWSYSNAYFSGGEYVLPRGDSEGSIPRRQKALPITRGTKVTQSSTEGISFASFVYPKERFALAAFFHQVTDFESQHSPEPILIRTDDCNIGPPAEPHPAIPEGITARDCNYARSSAGLLQLAVESAGVAGAWRLSKTLSLGLTVAYFEYSQDILEQTEFGVTQRVEGDDDQVDGSLGLLWKPGRWSFGAVYRRGPDFEGNSEYLCGEHPTEGVVPERACRDRGLQAGDRLTETLRGESIGGATSFKVPDVYSLGVSWRPSDRWMASFEYTHVTYSDLAEDVTNLLLTPSAPGAFFIDDADEFHLGGEHAIPFSRGRVLYIRAGVWHDPDHRLRMTELNKNRRLETRFGTADDREDDLHLTFGAGFTFGQRFQIDAAYDAADLVDTLSISGVYRFPRRSRDS